MTVFSPFAAIDDPLFTRRLSYVTDVLTSDDGTEQRAMLRLIPREDWTYLARTITAPTTGWLDALTYGGSNTLMTLPYWPHGVNMGAAAVAGSSVVLSVDTTNRDFVNGGRAVLWRSEGLTEEITLSGVSGSTITAATLASNWPAGTFVFPARRGRYTGDLNLRRLGPTMADVPLTFALEPGTDPGVSTPSLAVFTVVPYVRRDVTHALTRLVDRIDNGTDTYQDFPRRGTPVGARPLRVWLASRASVAALEAWFHGVKGRLAAFWLPTYQQDLTVTAGLGTASLTITRSGYTTYQFPHTSRKRLAFIQPNGTVTNRTVTASVDNGVATGTETLTLSGVAPAGTTLTSYLLHGRLTDDALEIQWRHNSFAECLMGFVEIPAEAA